MVLIRATSRLALLISLGVSRRSVADWKRRWNRCLISSVRAKLSCSSLIPRYSTGFIIPTSSILARGRLLAPLAIHCSRGGYSPAGYSLFSGRLLAPWLLILGALTQPRSP